MMLMTILEATVTPDKSAILLNQYQETIKHLPPEIVNTYLVKDTKSDTWRIMTIWKSKEAIEEMRKQGTPEGVLMFRAAGVEPELSIYSVEKSTDYTSGSEE